MLDIIHLPYKRRTQINLFTNYLHLYEYVRLYQHVSAITYSNLVLTDDGYRLQPKHVGVVSHIVLVQLVRK